MGSEIGLASSGSYYNGRVAARELLRSKRSEKQDEYDGKELYDLLLATLDKNTGGMQPPLHYQPSLVAMVASDQYRGEWVRHAIKLALSNKDAVRYTDENGDKYVGLRGEIRDRLRSYCEFEHRRGDPNKESIARANGLLSQMEGNES